MKLFSGLALALALSSSAFASELMVHGLSYHGKRTYEEAGQQVHYNEQNPGLTYFSDSGWGVGVYKNSYAKPSVHVSYRYLFNDNFGVIAGLASGYQDHKGPLMAGMVLRTPSYNGWRLVGMGQPFGKKYQVLTLSISKEL